MEAYLIYRFNIFSLLVTYYKKATKTFSYICFLMSYDSPYGRKEKIKKLKRLLDPIRLYMGLHFLLGTKL